jgi:glucose/arabinose dehydrogenase
MMKRLIILLALPILACSGLATPVSVTSTPLPPLEAAPATQTESQPATDAPTEVPVTVSAGSFPNSADYEWQIVANDLRRPVDVQSANDGTGRLFIIEKYGVIRVMENELLLIEPFLDIDDRVNDYDNNEMGLLGFAFHPEYEENGYFYVNYTGEDGNTRISRFHADGNIADPGSELVLLTIQQPYRNHNGGAVAFGPDGYLYLGLGDGGSAGDPQKNGQNTASLLGKILRIDVNSGDPYAIPSDNPFGNEVWAYGLRNPWRISFDRATGDLWIGDVGQNQWEEIDYFPAGGTPGANYGWSIMEGNHGYDGESQPGLLLPVVEYNHYSAGYDCSVTGGYVYRGSLPEWNGIYIYGDYCSGKVWGVFQSNGTWQNQLLFDLDVTIASFGEDEAGELYLASDSGQVYKLVKK